MLLDLFRSRLSSRHLPTIMGLENLGRSTDLEIAAAVEGTALEAAPLVHLIDGRRVLLAPLLTGDQALGLLRSVSQAVGGTALELPAMALVDASSIVALVAPG